jgi:DTW domain-containing protein YfiP
VPESPENELDPRDPSDARPHRDVCPGCGRPRVVCYCAAIEPLPTRTRVVILQHPRERHVGINTARIAHRALPNSTFHRAIDFSDDAVLQAALRDPDKPAAVLFPGPGAIDVREQPPPGPITLVVLDGTWWQASKLLKANPQLQDLPRYAVSPSFKSRYRIRRQPADHCLSTIEVLSDVLGVLEDDPERMAKLLQPFDAMVEAQLAYIAQRGDGRRRHFHEPKAPRPLLPDLFRERPESIVLAGGEINAWPRVPGEAPPLPEDLSRAPEIAHWVALRPATGERFEAFVRPRTTLAPSTAQHIRVPATRFAEGEPFDAFAARWAAWLREGDLLAMWGHLAGDVLSEQGATLPARLDLRRIAIDALGGRSGEIERCAEAMGATLPAPIGEGRAGARLAALVAITERLGDAAETLAQRRRELRRKR